MENPESSTGTKNWSSGLEERAISQCIFRMRSKRRASNPLRVLLPAVAPILVAGCALPIGVQIATLVADGVSLMTTKKTLTDHGLSAMTSKDCTIWRGVTGEEFCQEYPAGQGPIFVLNDEGPATAPTNTSGSFQLADASATEFTAPQLRAASVTLNLPTGTSETLVVENTEPAAAEKIADDDNAPRVIAEFVTASGATATAVEPLEPSPVTTTLSTSFTVESDTLPAPVVTPKPKATPEITPGKMPETNAKPAPGTYLVVASFTRETQARTYIAKKTAKRSLNAQVLSGTAKGRTVFRVAVGPVTKPDRPALRSRLTQAGFKGSWPLTLKAPRKIVELASVE